MICERIAEGLIIHLEVIMNVCTIFQVIDSFSVIWVEIDYDLHLIIIKLFAQNKTSKS